MVKLLGWCVINKSTVLEINLILVIVGVIFLLDVYNHYHIKSQLLKDVPLYNYELGLRRWLSWVRAITLVVYIANAILGMVTARKPGYFKMAIYLLDAVMLCIYTFSIAMSRLFYHGYFMFYTTMLMQQIWTDDNLDTLEREFDCCGKNGVIDYSMTNRTPSTSSCCELDDCDGCTKSFGKFLWDVELDIARDNIILFICELIGLIIMIVFCKSVQLVDDPYESESSTSEEEDDDHDETEERKTLRK